MGCFSQPDQQLRRGTGVTEEDFASSSMKELDTNLADAKHVDSEVQRMEVDQ